MPLMVEMMQAMQQSQDQLAEEIRQLNARRFQEKDGQHGGENHINMGEGLVVGSQPPEPLRGEGLVAELIEKEKSKPLNDKLFS